MKDLIIDFETLGTKDDSVVLSLGLAYFDDEIEYTWDSIQNNGICIKFQIKDQVLRGRKIYQDTLDWWKKQGEQAREVLKPSDEDITLDELGPIMEEFFKEHGINASKATCWTRGKFDHNLLQDIFQTTLNQKCPIPWWNVRDIRTCIDVLCLGNTGKVPGFKPHPETILHNALHDCFNDILQMQKAWNLSDVHSQNPDGN